MSPGAVWDLPSVEVFQLMLRLGLRETHKVLDFGCGSLRVGRFLIMYLNRGNYAAIDANPWLFEAAKKEEVGEDLLALKRVQFHIDDQFDLSVAKGPFDIVLASSILMHAGHPQIDNLFRSLPEVAPAGYLLADYHAEREDFAGTEWVYPEVISHTEECLARLAGLRNLSVFPVPTVDIPEARARHWVRVA